MSDPENVMFDAISTSIRCKVESLVCVVAATNPHEPLEWVVLHLWLC